MIDEDTNTDWRWRVRLRRARCEVCGGEFDVASAAITEHDGKIVHVICIPNIPAQ